MEDLLKEIAHAQEEQIELLLTAVLSRYAVLYPDWEISTISIQKTADRNQQIDRTIQMLERLKQR